MKPTTVNYMTFTRPESSQRLRQIVVLCQKGLTRQQLELALGLTRRTVGSYIAYLRDIKQIHISAWTREGLGQFYPIPVYKTGSGEDAIKPAKLTESERQARAWAKIKSDPVRHENHKAKKRKTPLIKRPSVFDWRGQPSIFTKDARA